MALLRILRGGLLRSAFLGFLAGTSGPLLAGGLEGVTEAQVGPRPYFLVSEMQEGQLRTRLESCEGPFRSSRFSIGHRGAALQFPEHTLESYRAAARMGAGVIECDVAFTSDQHLVCRHSQCDLHRTTDILMRPALAQKCSEAFVPADPDSGRPASAKCCTSDLTLAEFKSLCGKMDGVNASARTVAEFLQGTPPWRTDLYSMCGGVLSHKESLELFKEMGVAIAPELKSPLVEMPFLGDYSRQDYRDQLLQEIKIAGFEPQDVFLQSFDLEDIRYWIERYPEYASRAVLLDGRSRATGFDPEQPESWRPSFESLYEMGVRIVAPPIWMLVKAQDGSFVPTAYAEALKAAGLKLIVWTVERSGQPSVQLDWYYQGLSDAVQSEGDVFHLLEVLDQELGVTGVFSDWPATTTFYANCREGGP